MPASFWLVVAGLPVFHQPFPAAPDRPAVLALASREVSLRRACLQLRCADSEWRPPVPATTYAYADSAREVRKTPLPGAPLPGVRAIRAPKAARDWVAPYAGLDRIGARYGVNVVDRAETDVDIEVGTGYRWQPYVDNGSADTGPVARGRIELRQRIGARTRLNQQTRIEAGRDNTYVRNSLGVEVQLRPQWNLRSDLEVRHDTAGDGGDGRTDAEGSVKLHYAF